jgi:hypothetical protein
MLDTPNERQSRIIPLLKSGSNLPGKDEVKIYQYKRVTQRWRHKKLSLVAKKHHQCELGTAHFSANTAFPFHT